MTLFPGSLPLVPFIMNAKFRSERVHMTVFFALFVAFLMLLGGGAVWRHETRRAEARSREILNVAVERARRNQRRFARASHATSGGGRRR